MSVINTNTNTETIDFDQSTSSSSSSISAASYNRQLSSQFKQNQHPQMAFINPQQPQFNGQFTYQNQNLALDQFDYQQASDSQPIKLTISPYHPPYTVPNQTLVYDPNVYLPNSVPFIQHVPAQNIHQLPNEAYNKMNRVFVPLYCGTCRMYGCRCFYSPTPPPVQTPPLPPQPQMIPNNQHQNISIQVLPQSFLNQNLVYPLLRPNQESGFKPQVTSNQLSLEQQHQYYANAAATAYFNYLQASQQNAFTIIDPTQTHTPQFYQQTNQTLNSLHNSMSESLSDSFNKKLKIDSLPTSAPTNIKSSSSSVSDQQQLNQIQTILFQQQICQGNNVKNARTSSTLLPNSNDQTPTYLHSTVPLQQNRVSNTTNEGWLPNTIQFNNFNNYNRVAQNQHQNQHQNQPKQHQIYQQKQNFQPRLGNFRQQKKFAAYESIYSSSSCLSTPSTPPMTMSLNRSSGSSATFNSNRRAYYSSNQMIQSSTLCRHGLNCKFKRENKCKYFHPPNELPNGLVTQQNNIDIAEYSIDDNEIDFGKAEAEAEDNKDKRDTGQKEAVNNSKLDSQQFNSSSLSSSSSSLSSSKTLTNYDSTARNKNQS